MLLNLILLTPGVIIKWAAYFQKGIGSLVLKEYADWNRIKNIAKKMVFILLLE